VTDRRKPLKELYLSVDVETAGPYPHDYSLLAVGACVVFEPVRTFYAELQPVNDKFLPEAMQVNGLSLTELKEHGLLPEDAMRRFAAWIAEVTPADHVPVFVAFNAPFDWMFINDYCHRYLGHNPFGHNALDVKAFYMGLTGSRWHETSMANISRHYLGGRQLTHHALRDAGDQAEIFRLMLREARKTEPA
jgi:ribonuclease T